MHKVDFSKVVKLLKDLKNNDITMNYVEFTFLVSKTDAARMINLDATASLIRDVKLVNEGIDVD